MRAYKTIISTLFILLTAIMWGQENKIDSLKREILSAPSNEQKVKLLSSISEHYFDGQIYLDSSYYYAQEALDLVEETDNNYEKGRALFNLGLVETEFKNFDNALTYLLEAKQYVLKEDSAILLSIIYSSLGGLYLEKEDFSLATVNYEKAIAISRQENDTIGIAIDYINLGETRYKAGDYEQAKKDLEYCLGLLDSIGESFASAELNYGRTLFVLGDVEGAKIHGTKSYERSKSEENNKGISESAQFLSEVFYSQNNAAKALYYIKEAHAQKSLLNDAKELNEIEKLKLNLALSKKKAELDHISEGATYKSIIYLLGGLGILLTMLLISRQFRIRKMKEQIYDQQTQLYNSEMEIINKKDQMFRAFYSGKEADKQ